jgi:hypothetical protein
LFGLQLEVRACARNFVVVSGGLAWLRGLVASTASDFAAAGGPLADAAVLVHVLELLVKATRFSERHWLGQESDDGAGRGACEEESTSEDGSSSEAEAEGAEEADAAESEATAGKVARLTLQWECDKTVLCVGAAAAAWLLAHPPERGGGGAGVALAFVAVLSRAAPHARLTAAPETLHGLARALNPLSSATGLAPLPPPPPRGLASHTASPTASPTEALATLTAVAVARGTACATAADEAALAWAVGVALRQRPRSAAPLLLAACSRGALRLVRLDEFAPPAPHPTWLLTFAARTLAAVGSGTAASRLSTPLVAAAVACATVLAAAKHARAAGGPSATSAAASAAVAWEADGGGGAAATAAVCARIGVPCDLGVREDKAGEDWVDRVAAALGARGADAAAAALGNLAEGAFGPKGWLE